MLTPEKILAKTYTPRDLWETIERVTRLEGAIFEYLEGAPGGTSRDCDLWRALDNLPPARGGLPFLAPTVNVD
jgi:hypothetical protein